MLEPDDDIETCAAMIRFSGYGPTAIDPPEYCDREVVPGSEFCNQHQEPEEPDRLLGQYE